MNKAGWEAMADERLDDARTLLSAGRWSAGYHLIGYAIESALKVCVLNYVTKNPEIIFANKR